MTIKKAGTAAVRVSVAETGNYVAAEDVDVTITVAKAPGKGSVTIENWTYSPDGGNAVNPVPARGRVAVRFYENAPHGQ